MFHEKRRFFIAPVATANELAEKVTQMTWTLCTAFSLGDYLFLNDSTSEDGAQEYSVVKRQGDTFCQIESVTFGWMTLEGALKFIEETLAGTSDNLGLFGEVSLQGKLDTREEHGTCRFCA